MTSPDPTTYRVAVDEYTDCWRWQGTITSKGYGIVRVGERRVMAHRYVYEQHVGPIPEGMDLDHLCRNPPCVNPAHLEPVTNHENILRGLVPTANRTHCKSGEHEVTPDNIYVDSDGYERCRACRIESKRRYRQRMAA